jgi:hypothetical protein
MLWCGSKVKSWIKIRICIKMKSWIRTRIKVKTWIRIRIKLMRIRTPVEGSGSKSAIRIKVTWIRIRIKLMRIRTPVEGGGSGTASLDPDPNLTDANPHSCGRGRIRIRNEIKTWIRIRIKLMLIRTPVEGGGAVPDCWVERSPPPPPPPALSAGSATARGSPALSHGPCTRVTLLILNSQTMGQCYGSCGWYLTKWLERLTINAPVATVLGSIPASVGTVESEGRQMKQRWI